MDLKTETSKDKMTDVTNAVKCIEAIHHSKVQIDLLTVLLMDSHTQLHLKKGE